MIKGRHRQNIMSRNKGKEMTRNKREIKIIRESTPLASLDIRFQNHNKFLQRVDL